MSIRNELLEQILAASSGSFMVESPDDGNTYSAEGANWVNTLTQSANSLYVWDDDITATDPGTSKVKFNNADESLATEIYIAASNFIGQDFDSILNQIAIDDFIIFKRFGAQANFVIAKVTGAATDNTGWFTIPIAVQDNGGGFTAGDTLEFVYLPTAGRLPSDNFAGGLFDYNDATTSGTPINVTGGGGAVVLTNDGAGAFTNKLFPPLGVTDVWDDTTDFFDWSELKLGDMIDIRIDVDVITASVNTEIKIDLHLGTGGGSYTIPWILETNFKSTGTHKLNRYNGIYMGDTNTLNNGGQFMISSDKDCTVVINGWYCKIVKRG